MHVRQCFEGIGAWVRQEFKFLTSSNLVSTAMCLALGFFLAGCGVSSKTGPRPTALVLSTTSLQSGQVGTPYSASLSASGGISPYRWTLTDGTLPAGLTLNAATGAITGTPTASANAAPLTFVVKDSGNPAQSTSANLTLTIAAGALAITTVSLPNGQVGAPYSASLSASGGTSPYTWTLTSGTLPAGLTLNAATGAITGTPTASAIAMALTFSVKDSGSPTQNASATLTLTIATGALAITTVSLPSGQVGTAYSASLSASGGTSPYTWTLTSGTLPAGLTLNATSGAITGTPTASANATALTFNVKDSGSPAQNASAIFTLTIAPGALAITTVSLPSGQVGTAYGASLSASGGTSPYTWTLTSGTLPSGLTLNAATGAITGTPTASANATALTFNVKDSGSPAQNASANFALTITPTGAVRITTSSLPNGQVGVAYNASLSASGGVSPYTWTLSSGSLPTGLNLNTGTGAITGTPTASVNASSLTFTVKDSSSPVQSQSSTLAMTIVVATLTVSVSPKRAGVVTGQTLSVTPTTNDSLGVNWSVSGVGCSGSACGTLSSSSSLSGSPVSYIAPSTAGVYTITAKSSYDSTVSATVAVAVTDLTGVTTYHNNLARNGANAQEYALTPSTVTTSTFGKLFSCPVDGAIYAQPLWIPKLTIAGLKRNVVFVTTQHDSLYAFDADSNSNPCTALWHVNLLDAAHGGTSGETSVPSGVAGAPIDAGDIAPEVGVTGTPVIDPASNTLYVVSKSWISTTAQFHQRLHAIDLLTGNEKSSGPVTIAATFPGSAYGGTITAFGADKENQRPGLALVNGVVYVAWASHGDEDPFFGWVIGYAASTLSQIAVFNDAPNVGRGGIWMSGGAPAADSSNNLYLLTGNAIFDATNASPPNNDYGDAFLKLTPSLAVSQFFSPSNQATDNTADFDFGAGGAAVLADLAPNGSNPTHLVIGGGKDGALYVLNRDNLGGAGDSNSWQRIVTSGNGIYATGAVWNSHFYLAAENASLTDYLLNGTTGKMSLATTAISPTFGFPGSTPSVSSRPDNSNGIVWALDQTNYCTEQSPACGPVVLHAYSATDIRTELWNSSQGSGNAAGYAVKFTVPTIANGKVFVGTRGNNTGGADNSTSVPGELDIYGLIPD